MPAAVQRTPGGPWTASALDTVTRCAAALLILLGTTSVLASCSPDGEPEAFEPILLLVSLDGFRWDYLQRGQTPNLTRLAERGVRSERLIPVFPSKTFPNHYSIVTGLYPEHHGIVANTMYDPVLNARFRMSDRQAVGDERWWGGEPIWVTAEKQGLLTAPFFWVGSEAPIQGFRPTYWQRFDDDFPNSERVDQVLAWLDLPSDERPSFLTLYFSDVDTAAHDHDPDSAPEVAAAVREVDNALGRLLSGLDDRGLSDRVNIIVVSDHGMTALSPERVILIDEYLDLEVANVVDWNPVLALWPAEDRIEEVYRDLVGAHPHLQVFRRQETPERLRYLQHRRIAPIVALADEGWWLGTKRGLESVWTPEDHDADRFPGGTHGYDPALESMGALFIGAGPAFRKGLVVPPFENIHLYNLMCEILGLEAAPNDGDPAAILPLLADSLPKAELGAPAAASDS